MTTTASRPAVDILAAVALNLDDRGHARPKTSHGPGWVALRAVMVLLTDPRPVRVGRANRAGERDDMTRWVYADGGRFQAGFKGTTGDCVTRAVAIATRLPYQEVYDALNAAAQRERPRNGRRRSSARTGVSAATCRRYLADLGWEWTPTMGIGTGCTVHLDAAELPPGRLIVAVSRHYCAVIDGVIYDTHDPSRPDDSGHGTRCVYGYYTKPHPGQEAGHQ